VLLVVVLHGDGVFTGKIWRRVASAQLRVEGESDRVDGANGSQTAPVVFHEHYALATAPKTK
jgi:hypothetical protein